MKKHNATYAGVSITIRVAGNGFIVGKNEYGSHGNVFRTFQEATEYIARNLGLTEFNETVTVRGSLDG